LPPGLSAIWLARVPDPKAQTAASRAAAPGAGGCAGERAPMSKPRATVPRVAKKTCVVGARG